MITVTSDNNGERVYLAAEPGKESFKTIQMSGTFTEGSIQVMCAITDKYSPVRGGLFTSVGVGAVNISNVSAFAVDVEDLASGDSVVIEIA